MPDPPAVINAVLNALSDYDVDDIQMPATPERVWQAMRAIFLLLPPAVLIMTQFVVRMGMEPVRPAEVIEVTVQLAEDAPPEAWDVQLVGEGAVVRQFEVLVGQELRVGLCFESREGFHPIGDLAGIEESEGRVHPGAR